MIGLIRWIRSFTYDSQGQIVRNADGPLFAAHPQPNLWTLIATEAAADAQHFDLIQLPPATNGTGEGYSAFCLRNYNSNWGTKVELTAAIREMHAAGLRISLDLVYRQMSGENSGPGVFIYANYPGSTTASWFQNFGQTGETNPPFVAQDDVPNPAGNYAFGRVRSYQNCIPPGVVEADTISAFADAMSQLGMVKGMDYPRWDDCKGMHAPSVRRILDSQPGLGLFGEYFSGDASELYWYVHTVMQSRLSVEDYSAYWCIQRACNQYDATQLDAGNQGFWRWDSAHAVGFVNNADVATSWSVTGGISQQIAFNLLLAYAWAMCLPFRLFVVYGEDYFPSSREYPTGRGLKPYLDNLTWFARKFAFGNFARCWVDKDVYAYTRDGAGGEVGWSGGCLVVVNFNTLDARSITVQTAWAQGQNVHNYSMTGQNENYIVGAGGLLSVTVKSNFYSGGQSYLLIAPSGVSGSIPMAAIS